jgi:hypothetical protein
MQDLKLHLEKLLRDAAEYRLISDLSTDTQKRQLFSRLADHHAMLAGEIEHAIAKQFSDNAFAQEPALGTTRRAT